MVKNVLVVYFTQTGQLREIVDSVTTPLVQSGEIKVTYEELKPDPLYRFPWNSDQFFQAMPESVQGIPCKLKPLTVKGDEDFDLIILAWQPWFLSPSIPVHAFLQNPVAKRLLAGKPVISLIGSRNMWVMAQKCIKEYLRNNGSRLVGNILLFDRASNLLSVISIIRWMFKGKKERYLKIIPPAGISDEDIKNASRYGTTIKEALLAGNFDNLNEKLIRQGAIDVNPAIVMIEKRGIIFFRIWARFILKKGGY
ncbi:MAG TPA: hypothetical protein VHI78_08295, partial [Bacteroidales bacterium]|nr:hypothetical protein [Bacteroidales bacterium]